jgi:hypothetical protein
MKTKWMTLTALAFALSTSIALGSGPAKSASHSNGTGHTNQYHDRTPHVHERSGSIVPR